MLTSGAKMFETWRLMHVYIFLQFSPQERPLGICAWPPASYLHWDVTYVTRTSTSSMAPIHFPSCPHSLPIPGGLHAHTHAIPILVDCTLSLPILVVFPLITPFTSLHYICSPDPRFASPMPSRSTGTILIISRALYLTVSP